MFTVNLINDSTLQYVDRYIRVGSLAKLVPVCLVDCFMSYYYVLNIGLANGKTPTYKYIYNLLKNCA